jgi:hydrogenase expression/formation protein HypD
VRYVDEYRDAELGRALATEIVATVEPARHYKVMEVCGGHTHTIYKYGLDDLLPANVEFVHGPGCPVCVIPMGRVDDGIAVARRPGVIFTCFGDMMRIPGGDATLLEAKAEGADVRMVYSPLDALRTARENPDREVVFYAIGFETTAPSTALTLLRAKAEGIPNFFVFCNHVTVLPPLRALLESPDLRLDGFIGPAMSRPSSARARSSSSRASTAGRSSSPASSRSTCSSRCRWCSASSQMGAARSRTSTRASSPTTATSRRST